MFSWGEDCQQGFRLKDASNSSTADGVHFLNISFHITDLSAGRGALAFVKSSGDAFIIRINESKDGRRTRGKQKYVKCPERIQAVSCCDDTVTLLSESGDVLCVDTTRTPFNPRPLEALCNIPVSQVACGSQHSVALSKDGQVFTWGQDSRGQLGLGKRKLGANSPQHLRALSAIPLVQIAAGGEQSFALSVSGGVFGWGRNDCGQLGLGDKTDRHTPTSVQYLNMKKTVHISCGNDHTAILTKEVHEMSNTESVSNVKQDSADDLIDTLASTCDSKSLKKIKQEIHRIFSSASCLNQCFLDRSKDKHFQTSPEYSGLNLSLAQLAFKKLAKKDGVLAESHFTDMFSWGEDCQQGFRLKDASNFSTADGVHFLNISFHITDLSAGRGALVFVKSSGDAFIIRINESKDGRRTRGKQKYVKCPERIQAVSCCDDTVTLLSESGDVLCVDTTRTPFSPRPLEALSNIPVSQVACGSQHSVALSKDGQVFTWGQDSRGQLGLGKRKLGANSPQHLRALSAIPLVQIAAGGEQSFALSVSGGVFGWGRNDCGQLGLGDKTDRHTPTSVQYLNMKKTVHISCGNDHTAILTKDGAVFTFGSGQYGQLGHNSFSNELRPRLVAELWGAKVTKIACGRRHTLVLTNSKRVYSFGCDENGQRGNGEKSHPSVPLPVQLPPDFANGLVISNVFAGENCSFATCMSIQEVHEMSNTESVSNVKQDSADDLIDTLASTCDSKSLKKIKQEIHRIFSSASCLNQCFLDRSKDKHFQTSPEYSGLNLSLAQLAFKKLAKKDGVLAEVEAAVLQLLPSLDEKPVGVEGLRIFLLLNELLHVIQRHRQSSELAKMAAAAIRRLSAESLQVIVDWWSSLSRSTMIRHVKVWREALSLILSSEPDPRNSGVKNLLLVLQYMYKANNRIAGCQKIQEKTFFLEANQTFLQEDLWLWHSMKNVDKDDQPLILCNFPFVMGLKSKRMAFDINAERTQREAQAASGTVYGWPFGWVPASPNFELRLRRASLFEDTFTQLASKPHSDFKKPLVVYLDEDPKLTDVYKRDFFHHLFHDLVSAESGMFLFNDSETLAWFPSKATEEDKTNFFLFGVLCGLALYNQSIIHLPFPLALFKKLLGVEPTLEDLKEFSSIGQTVDILDYEDDVIENLYIDFGINWDGTDVDLDPQNPGKPVTGENKEEFVDAYVNHIFNASVEGVFQEFERGFFQVCDRDLVKLLFRPEELQGVLVGEDVYDWAKLKQNTVYDWIFHNGHPVIQMFWEVFDELTEDQRKDFIWFLTGFRRVPILGMNQIRMQVRVKMIESGSEDQHYPESLTCHSILELPLYSSKEIMRDRLTEALIPERGFLV